MKRLMYIVFFLLMAANLLAQENYVIDSVCIGAERTYRRDGEAGYTYYWEIVDRQINDTIFPTGEDFIEINGTDTTWGNQIGYRWEVEGEFDIVVKVFSEHKCDTIEQGYVKVFEEPFVYAGPDSILCDQVPELIVSGDTAWNYSALYWETLGDGSFVDDGRLHPTYRFGPTDIANGEVSLVLKADGFALNNTCEPVYDTVTFLFSSPEITLDPHDPICYSDSTGYIIASIDGGLPSFSYSWEGPPGFVSVNSDSIGGLWAGTYILTVTDGNLCVDIDTVELFDPPQLLATIDSVRDVSCYGYADGFIWASAQGGTGELSFEWTGPNGYTASEDSIFDLAGGEYFLRVFDEYGCEVYDTVIVDEPDPLIALIDSAMDVQCYGFNNGYAHVIVTDGTGPYTYLWNSDPIQDSTWAFNLAPGWITATITDFNGCMAWDSVYIDEPEPLLVTADSIDVRCDGDKPGEIHLAVSGGNRLGNAPYYYFEWFNEADSLIATTKDVYNLAGDQYYTVYVSDALGCADTLSVYVNEIPMMVMEVSIDSALCYLDPWNIRLDITEGRPPYIFEWTDTAGTVLGTVDSLMNIPAGIYTVTVTDADTCVLTEQFHLVEPPLITVDITADDSILCVGEELILFGNPEGGRGVITQAWTGDAYLLDRTDKQNVIFANSGPGGFDLTYTIIDEYGCDATDNFHIDVYPPDYVYDSMEVCAFTDPFTWNEDIIITSDADRSYRDTLVNQWGCDSIVTLYVDVLFPEYYDTTIYICENDAPQQPYGNITILPDRDSIYLDTVRYVDSHCDSLLVTIEVFTKPVTYAEFDTTLCAGADTFQWNNRLIQTDFSQVYLDTLFGMNEYGCDSFLTYNVTINPPDTTFMDSTFCQDEPDFVWNEITIVLEHDSVYQAVLSNQFGCDSIVEYSVFVLPVTDTLLELTFCAGPGDSILNNRTITFDESRIYLDTLYNANQFGCDSLLTYDVTILPPDTVTIDTTICEGEPLFAWGVITVHQVDSYTDSIYTDILQNQFGCDSIVYLDVEILRPIDSMLTVDLCASDSFFWDNTWYAGNRDSMYFDTLYYAAGCDSLRLQLEIISHPLYDTTMFLTLCEGSVTEDWEGHSISSFMDSTYTTTWPTEVWDCDSTLTLVVNIVPAFKDTIREQFCFGEPIADWYEYAISSEIDSVYIHNIPGPTGCDTLYYYEVTINPVTDTMLYYTFCAGPGDTMINNQLITFDQSQIYFDTLFAANQFDCDSTLIYDVTILAPDTASIYETYCMDEIVPDWNGIPIQTQTDSIYQATITNDEGCDSMVILYTTILQGGSTYDTVYACVEYYWEAKGETYTETGDDFNILGSATACPDTSWLHVVISDPLIIADSVNVLCYGDSTGSISINVSGGVEPYAYLWSNGATTPNITGLTAGTYTVTITDALTDTLGCKATLDVTIEQPDELQIALDTIIHVLVTGESTGSIEVSVNGGTEGTGYKYEWTNETGDVVDSTQNLYNQPAGEYTLMVWDTYDCSTTITATIFEPVPIDKYMAPLADEICYEDLENYPVATSLSEYLALDTTADVYSLECGLDTSTFHFDILKISNGVYCYEEIRTYSIVDLCGDTLSATHRIIVNDQEAPTISCPDNFSVATGLIPAAYDSIDFLANGGMFDDNCAVVSFTMIDERIQTLSDHILVTRTYEVADHCGNPNQCEHQIRVYSDVDLALDCSGLPKVYYQCYDFRPVYNTVEKFEAAGGSVYHTAPIDTFYYTDVVRGTYCPTITRTYHIRDDVGQEETCTQVFQVLDNEVPVATLPDKHFYCNETLTPYYSNVYDVLTVSGNIVSDNCSLNRLSIALKGQTSIGTCPIIIERIYELRDGCDNRTEVTELIYVHDTIAPVVTDFENEITVSCDVPEPYIDASIFATDDCGDVEIIHVKDSLGGIDEPGVVYRFYTFTDGCNDVPMVQKITVVLDEVAEFDGLSPLCQFTPSPVLPDTSKNGITGHWEIDSIPTDVAGTFTYIFYPDSGQCAGPADIVVEILPAIRLSETHIDQGYDPNPVGRIDLDINDGSGVYTINWNGPNGYTATSETIANLYAGDYWVEVSDNIGCYDSISVTLLAFEPEFSCPPDTIIECPDITQYPAATNIAEFIAYGGYYSPVDIVADLSSIDRIDSSEYCMTVERTYVVEDIYGRVDSCTQMIYFFDDVPPVVVAPQGDTAECLSTVVPRIETLADFLSINGTDAYDPNCTIDPSSFTVRDTAIILEPGRSQVIFYFSIADFCGNIGRDTTYYLITDDQAPEVWCADITVYLDENGNYQLTVQDSVAMIDSMYDNCTAPEDMKVVIELTAISCEDVESGAQARIIVYDQAGLSAECIANITVVDTVPPTAVCQDITVYLDETGVVTITYLDIDNGSWDNCGIETYQITPDRFDCYEVGENSVSLIVTDYYGLSDTCTSIVTVVDTIAPEIVCKPLQTIQLDEYGEYVLTWNDVVNNVSDECGIDTVLLDRYLLDCEDIGTTYITAIAYDVNGNADSCTAEFEVFGNIPPNVVNDSAVTAVNVAVEIPVTNNDYDLKTNINLASLGIVIGPSHGSVVVDNNTGIVTYTPDLDYEGPDVFRYTICDDGIPCEPECGEAIVFITVRPQNNPPLAVDDYFEVPCGDLFGNIILNDSDPDGDNITVNPVPVTEPDSGYLELFPNGNFEYIPFEGFFGTDSFQYVICDDGIPSLCDTAWVYIKRVADNDCDGVADAIDIDDDNDGIRDNIENGGYWPEDGMGLIDSDHDGIPDYMDIDSDNDGIVDNIEGQGEHNYIPPSGIDENGDGWDDIYDVTIGGVITFDEDLTDTDGDSMPDYLDIDSDNDGVWDLIEGHDDDNNGIADVLRWYSDEDRDGLDDAYDTYSGWADYGNETASNAPLQDFDGDGTRDWRDINDEDDDYLTVNEDLNGNGDYSDDDLDLDGYPEYLDTELNCELFIPEGFSPNDDGVHDFFQILCIQKYPNAKLMIFNRNGVKLWEKEHYGNLDVWGTYEDAWWWGTSENRLTIGRSGGLPAGNYIYVLILNDGLGTVKNGTVMLAY
ncbi:Ig-like domain-containing protein [Draconibacterium sp. IB214405]|uniref:Ig-like domain-containing protein n=1 Tax=Draconibacterium sp. IB214405 TaxID=3097352 RepID=UPI002A0F5E4E|nr:Ig-like domain-containing protein [Draconibacterium sp. IB214405]MDX8337600.1 Ig-like domain-containing protein [Draconibacterium sp. IB214405]